MRKLVRRDLPFVLAGGVYLLIAALFASGVLVPERWETPGPQQLIQYGLAGLFLIYGAGAVALALSRLTWRWVVLGLMLAGSSVFGLAFAAITFLT